MEFRLKFWERAAMTAALALAFSMEQADVGVLQSMYGPIGRSLQVSAVALGTLTTWRGVVQVQTAQLVLVQGLYAVATVSFTSTPSFCDN